MCVCVHVRVFVYVRQLLPLCVLGCNQQHSLCGLLCSLIGVLANHRGREGKCFFSCVLCCSLASELEEPGCGLEPRCDPGALHIGYIRPSIYHTTVSLPPCVCQRLYAACVRVCAYQGCSDSGPMLAAVSFVQSPPC